MPDRGLKELYVDELKDLYSAETQLVKALPKMAKAASSDELRQGFEKHLQRTWGHVQRLEKIFQALGESPKGKMCKGMHCGSARTLLFSFVQSYVLIEERIQRSRY
jgi:ferritin-like metal-binding protein YciE